ncbi:Mitochondrial import inner membrane translocase subunit Tim10 [Tetrabaena socialis]|uniref:Mitochondrial import inner membrane translocase subunit n=1 Tax=Tetrabaena socialis TaxID=47790 RepID=A0A2J7ZHU6_9CHLO|nr:Mitochondrial import inner membrane translocase subunit Tim10 [Tetrabaena socialis]|eukprot:PNG99799.1 Mitochondrial import inner membrane translocase subunit Tim10 [Tetrabaena socialis]
MSSNDDEQRAEQHAVAAAALTMATTELEYRVSLLNSMVGTCHERYKEGTLSVGENSCIDRCCAKYWQVVAIVGQLLGSQK